MHSTSPPAAPPAHLGFAIVGVEAMDQGDHLLGGVVEVEEGREGIQAGGVELVALLHGEFAKSLKVALLDVPNHLGHALWDQHFCTVLEDRRKKERRQGPAAAHPGKKEGWEGAHETQRAPAFVR